MSSPLVADRDFIVLQNVAYAYPTGHGADIIQQIDLNVRPGEYLLICGASGAGKSTLCRTFNGLIPHFYGGRLRGIVKVAGQPTSEQSVADLFHQVGLVFQNPQAQLFNSTVRQELAFGLESLGLPRPQMTARISAVATELGIEALLERHPQALSGGEQQLVAIAALLTLQPSIMVLDEPLANLDPAHGRRLRTLLRRLCGQGMGVVVCEHRMASTLPDADRIVLIEQGRKILDEAPDRALSSARWTQCGVELPLAVQIGHRLGLHPAPRTIAALPVKACSAIAAQAVYAFAQAPADHPCGSPVLQVENVSYAIDKRVVVDNVSVELYAGRCAALIGANGAGKTTLLKLINGLLRPAAGRICIKGQNIADQPAWQVARNVGTAFQNPNHQFFKMTVQEEILVGPKAMDRHDPQWIDALVTLFKLEPLLARAPFKLSGGEKKRVAFAAALAAKPEILLLDEPTAGQDGHFRKALTDCLDRLRRQGATILIVTHTLSFAQTVADRWLVMADGRLIADGPPRQLMADQQLMESADLEPTEAFQWEQKCGHPA